MSERSGIVLWHVTMSLDGFIAGPGDAMSWVFRYAFPEAEVEEVIRTTGAVLVGRRSYDVGRREGTPPEGPEGLWWSLGRAAVRAHPRAPDSEEDPTITFLSGDVRDAVARARAAADGKNVVLIGATVARQCVEAGLVDEILCPPCAHPPRDGVRFFDRPGTAPIELERIGVTQSTPLTNLRFRVVKRGLARS